MKTKELQGPVCRECGLSALVLTCLRRYHNRPNTFGSGTSTYTLGTCAACGEVREVTEQRDFFYPDFTLLQRAKLGMSLRKIKPI